MGVDGAVGTVGAAVPAPIHQLGAAELELLEAACLLHDVAGGSDLVEHPFRSARQVAETELDGFPPDERRAIAVLIAIHRATEAQGEVEGWLTSLPARLERSVQLLGPLLRLADGFDASRRQSVRAIEAEGMAAARQATSPSVDLASGFMTPGYRSCLPLTKRQ